MNGFACFAAMDLNEKCIPMLEPAHYNILVFLSCQEKTETGLQLILGSD